MTKNVWQYLTKSALAVALVVICYAGTAGASEYENTVSGWTSHKDVAAWLKDNFKFDKKRQKVIQKRLRAQGPDGLLIRDPATLYGDRKGYCADAANFANHALAKINPDYNPRWVFIENSRGKPNHWLTGFNIDGKIYLMDYGTGTKWEAMMGVHGPYDSLEEYADYLGTLDIKGFGVADIRWRDMPGTVD